MTRKEFLQTTFMTSLGLVATPILSRIAHAEVSTVDLGVDKSLIATTTIERNHGHALLLSTDSLVLAFRTARENGFVEFDIQGESRHPHTLRLTESELLQVLGDGVLETLTSEDSGHSHRVSISLLEQI